MWKYNATRTAGELYHYASPYYDPVKAHEYYMRTRQLKGRRSTVGLGKEGQAIAKVIKENLTAERKAKTSRMQSEANTKARNESSAIQDKIATIRAKLKGMSKEERAQNREGALKDIAELRDEIKTERANILRRLGLDISALGKEYDEKYYDELDKLRSRNSTSAAVKKRATTSSGSSVKQTVNAKPEPKTHPGGRKKVAMTK